MERTFKITVVLKSVTAEGDDEESLKESVKDALLLAIENDDTGEEDIDFNAEELDEDL